MVKLDSFLKEIMRCYPQSASTQNQQLIKHHKPVLTLPAAAFQRKVMKPFTLPNGQTVPAGVIIEVPSHAVNNDESIYAHHETFDALRFYRIRKEAEAALGGTMSPDDAAAEAAAGNQFASVTETSLAFGYGRNACPGRFLAANEIKMILATALLEYDVAMPPGCDGRYENLNFGSQVSERSGYA